MDRRIHLATLYSIVVALAPIAWWVDGRYAHAEDALQSHTQIMFQTQQNGLDIRKSSTEIEIRRLTNKMHQGTKLTTIEEKDFDILHEQKTNLQIQQEKLNELMRKEIK